jgi:FAD binding domain
MHLKGRNKHPIVIAGGGIGGLACALALAQQDFSVIVCEQASEFGQVGVGLQVAPNALSVLDALGVGERAKKDALLIERMLMVDGIDGRTICDIPCGPEFIARFGNPYAVAHRAVSHRITHQEPCCRLCESRRLRAGTIRGRRRASRDGTHRRGWRALPSPAADDWRR